MSSTDTHPTDTAPVVRLGRGSPELLNMRWGFEPHDGSEPIINIRAESADLASNRCLVPAAEWDLFTGDVPKRRRTVTLKEEPLFFFAALWRQASANWPESYAILTIDAAPDLARLTDRQPAVIRAADASAWLTDASAAADLLKPLPKGSYQVKG